MIISVNGVKKEAPLGIESSLGELLDVLRNQYSTETSCISSIQIDEQEISEREEAAIALLPLSDFQKIQIFTAHPRELAEETLQNLLAFTDHLSDLSKRSATQFLAGEHPSLELARLFDGIQTFGEAIESTKQILRISQLGQIPLLEADLLSIMGDLLESYHQGNRLYLIDLLQKYLPQNMMDWKNDGIPALIRSRDS